MSKTTLTYNEPTELLSILQRVAKTKTPKIKMGKCGRYYRLEHGRLKVAALLSEANIMIIARILDIFYELTQSYITPSNSYNYYCLGNEATKLIESKINAIKHMNKINIICHNHEFVL